MTIHCKPTWYVVMKILKTKNRKVLGVTFDNKLNFATHSLNITKNANKKFIALMRVQKYMTTDQKSLYFLLYWIPFYLLSIDMNFLYKMFPSQNKQYTWAAQVPYTAKLHIWIWKTLRECKWKIGSPGMHWISFDWDL